LPLISVGKEISKLFKSPLCFFFVYLEDNVYSRMHSGTPQQEVYIFKLFLMI
jgi:hypothetical protein